MKIPFKWETLHKIVDFGDTEITKRAKVPGGWLVRDYKWCEGDRNESIGLSLVFVSDPNHEWEIE